MCRDRPARDGTYKIQQAVLLRAAVVLSSPPGVAQRPLVIPALLLLGMAAGCTHLLRQCEPNRARFAVATGRSRSVRARC
jgi:hypothetical protein